MGFKVRLLIRTSSLPFPSFIREVENPTLLLKFKISYKLFNKIDIKRCAKYIK